jgi:tetratricopeptide (TPR) repeat protein
MGRTRRARVLVGLCALLLAGCAQHPPLPQARLAGLPSTVELADTPFFPQERYQCGPAALATLLTQRGVAVTPEALVPQVYLPARAGSLQVEIVAAVRRQALLALPIEPALDALLAEIAAGHPVLVLQNLGLDWMPRWHYAVVIGYDLERQELVLRSGTERRRITPFGVFLNTWNRAERWGLVVLAPGTLPARPRVTPYLEAASALESFGRHEAARAAFQAATEQWPDNPVAWLGLGNADYALGAPQHAEQAFRRALDVEAGSPAAWNNLAYALARQQCVRAAQIAAQCARRLAPDSRGYADTENEIGDRPPANAKHCRALPACPVQRAPESVNDQLGMRLAPRPPR